MKIRGDSKWLIIIGERKKERGLKDIGEANSLGLFRSVSWRWTESADWE